MRIKCDLPFHIVKIILDMDIALLCLTFSFHFEPQFLLYNINQEDDCSNAALYKLTTLLSGYISSVTPD